MLTGAHLAPLKKRWSAAPAIIENAIKLLDLGEEDGFLDFGCGTGNAIIQVVTAP